MKRQRRPFGFATWHADDQLLTDSVVMSESDVRSMLDADPDEDPGSRNTSGIVLSGFLLSRREELLFWVLILLALLAA